MANNSGKTLSMSVDLVTPEDAKKRGYISGSVVGNLLFEHVCGGNYNNPGAIEGREKCFALVKRYAKSIRIGEGKATRYYYLKKDVMSIIDVYKNGVPVEDLKLSAGPVKNRTDESPASLKNRGYISGTTLGNILFGCMTDLPKCQNSMSLYGKAIYELYNKEFAEIRKSDEIQKYTLGSGRATSHYYFENDVKVYIQNHIIPKYS